MDSDGLFCDCSYRCVTEMITCIGKKKLIPYSRLQSGTSEPRGSVTANYTIRDPQQIDSHLLGK